MTDLDEAADKVHGKANAEASVYGLQVITIVIDEFGAWRLRCGKGMDMNVAVGVMERAKIKLIAAFDAEHDE